MLPAGLLFLADVGGLYGVMSASLLDDGRAELVKSPFVVSWFSRARSGDLTDPDPARRASAYAAWAVEALAVCSNGRRNYPALRLDGDFYDPAGTGPRVKPHLEIPQRLLRSSCPDFPDRLAQAGNAMRFP